MAHRGVGSQCRKQDVFQVIRSAPRKKALLFLDPPYLVAAEEGQYNAGDFTLAQHQALAKALHGRAFVLCHREDDKIRSLYPGCEIVQLPAIMNINGSGKSRKELVIIGRPAQ